MKKFSGMIVFLRERKLAPVDHWVPIYSPNIP